MSRNTGRASLRDPLPYIIVLLILAVDQLTKTIVFNTLGPGTASKPLEFFGGLIVIHFRANSGAAFSLLRGQNGFFIITGLIIIGVMVVYYRWASNPSVITRLGLGLTVGGAMGNLVDRLHYGFVVDFIGSRMWPTFNIADAAIDIGIFLLAISILFMTPKAEATNEKCPQ